MFYDRYAGDACRALFSIQYGSSLTATSRTPSISKILKCRGRGVVLVTDTDNLVLKKWHVGSVHLIDKLAFQEVSELGVETVLHRTPTMGTVMVRHGFRARESTRIVYY
jgi:hypothetical protein